MISLLVLVFRRLLASHVCVLLMYALQVNLPFWGTRLPHLIGIPACLLFYDHTVSAVFTRYLGMVSFAATPSLALVNLFCYTWLAVGTFISADAMFNPLHEGRRVEHVKGCVKPLTVGMSLQWHLPLMLDIFGCTSTGFMSIVRNAFAIALVFFPVKALGFGDYGQNGLTVYEKIMNGMVLNMYLPSSRKVTISKDEEKKSENSS